MTFDELPFASLNDTDLHNLFGNRFSIPYDYIHNFNFDPNAILDDINITMILRCK